MEKIIQKREASSKRRHKLSGGIEENVVRSAVERQRTDGLRVDVAEQVKNQDDLRLKRSVTRGDEMKGRKLP